MKLFFALFALVSVSSLFQLSFASNLTGDASNFQLRRQQATSGTCSTCGDPCSAVAFLRGSSAAAGDHFYTTSPAEMENAIAQLGYVSEGTACQLFAFQATGTVPFYRLNNPSIGDHFYTTDAGERDNAAATLGYVEEGIAAYVYPQQICASVPLYRLVSAEVTDHFYTTSEAERDAAIASGGYSSEGIATFVLPA